jgi:kynurenine formamidase
VPDRETEDAYQAWLEALAANPRFGPKDRKGTANFIDDAARQRAADAMTTGRCTSLSRPLSVGPEHIPGDGKLEVEVTHRTRGTLNTASDVSHVAAHGQHRTHLDAFNHIGRHGTWYGGFAVDDPAGPSVLDLANHKLFTRGVVADIPAVRGTDWVDPAAPVTGEDIDRALDAGEMRFEPGDALLLYMGRDRWEAAGNHFDVLSGDPMPGAGLGAAHWIVDHGVSLVCWDFQDGICDHEPRLQIHSLIWAIGLPLVDNCDLAPAVAATQASDSIGGGLVVAPPPVPRATGWLVDPIFIQ